MSLRFARSLVLFSLMLLVPLSAAHAQWVLDGTPLCTVRGVQTEPSIISDGAGGAYLAWVDYRGTSADVYLQRVSGLGAPLWAADGVVVCNAANDQINPVMVLDGSGGVIVVWEDPRTNSNAPNIYAQRVNKSGVVQWAANGVAVATSINFEANPRVISDGAAGAIVTWEDGRSSFPPDIFARRINSAGVPQWTAGGVSVCTSTGIQDEPDLVSDGAGGAIVSWKDVRSGKYNIYARRINASGVAQWTADGNVVCGLAFNDYNPVIAADGAGGAVIAWSDLRNVTQDIYAQRVNGSGVMQWPTDGVAICAQPALQYDPHIISDGLGGAILSWSDNRTNGDVYARRVNASGAPLWAINGVPIGAAGSSQYESRIVSDGAGGAIIAWMDFRSGIDWDLYAQKVTANGLVQWLSNGTPVCMASDDQSILVCAADGTGGAIVAWNDLRSGDRDIFAQRVEGGYGYWGHPEPVVTKVADIQHDQGGKVAVNWIASGRDLSEPRTIDHYSIWRAVNTYPLNAGPPLTDIARVDKNTRGPVYAALASVPGYYWELVATQDAHAWPGYSLAAPTRVDSVASAAGNEAFMVAAHEQYDTFVAFASNALSGHSVDNLAPTPPLALVAQRVGPDVYLRWNRVHVQDLRDYTVYRKTSAGVTPVPVNFLASAHDTVLVDSNVSTVALYYVVTANDVHANQSAPSNEASVARTTGVGGTPPISGLTVLSHHPNPFGTSATVDVGLPGASRVQVDIFDVAGRRVSSRSLGEMGKGWQRIVLRATDDAGKQLVSGVYFYRITAAGEAVTRKMVITR